jgi:hypothetical protein
MRSTAFKFIMAAIVVTAASAGAHVAKAETTLKVPFSFIVSGKSMPAGLYTVQESTFHNLIIFRTKDASKSFSYTLQPGDDAPSASRVALKFDDANGRHILRAIQLGSRTTSRLDNAPAPQGFDPARLSQGR